MKRTLLLIVAAMFFACNSNSRNKPPDNSARINFIRAQFALINKNIKSYKKVDKEDTAETTEGNEVDLYYSRDTIKKISAEYFGETGKSLEEYYFYNNKLIFYYSLATHYKLPFYLTKNPLIASKNEERYYFNNGAIVKYIYSQGKKIPANEANKTGIETLKEANRLMHLQ